MLLVVGLLAGCTRGASDVAAPQSTTRTDRSAPGEDGSTGGGSQEQLEPGTTAIFRGGPATGPWQQIGSVAEITHPRAAPTARMSYDENWAARGLPNELWDELVARVSVRLVELGPPANRPTFDAAPGSEPFNSGAGVEGRTANGLLVAFLGSYLENGVAVEASFPFLVDGSTFAIEATRSPILVSERDADTRQGAVRAYYGRVSGWLERRVSQ